MLSRLGKAEGIAGLAIFFTAIIGLLLWFGKISGDQFVGCFQFLVTTFFTGTAVAAFRDSFGAGNVQK